MIFEIKPNIYISAIGQSIFLNVQVNQSKIFGLKEYFKILNQRNPADISDKEIQL